jgi:SulP family sulfate permease
MKSARLRSIVHDVIGALAGALTVVPIILSCGAVLYESMGSAWVTAGISAAFVAAVVAAIVAALSGGTPLHMNSPKTTHAAILSGLIASVAADPSFAAGNGSGSATLLLVASTALLVSGIVQTILGASRLGLLVKFIPYPVLAGFINGFAIQIILNQLPRALDLDGPQELLRAFNGTVPVNWWALGFAFLSGGFAILAKKRSGPVPAALIGLFAGTALGRHDRSATARHTADLARHRYSQLRHLWRLSQSRCGDTGHRHHDRSRVVNPIPAEHFKHRTTLRGSPQQ